MGCIFFEGFNYSDSDYTTLDPTYWSGVSADASISKPDYGSYTFKKGRTSRAHVIPARDAEENDILKSSSLMLSVKTIKSLTLSGNVQSIETF
mgnify:CR=1 FL=1